MQKQRMFQGCVEGTKMRMWMISPWRMCNKHLLGEHVELHMLVGHLKRGRHLGELARKGFVEPRSVMMRHYKISMEMERRGMRHDSPIDTDPMVVHLEQWERDATVERGQSMLDLINRCESCRSRWVQKEGLKCKS